MEKEEIYKIIPGHENYLVSDHGNVMNAETGKIIKSSVNSRGTIVVNLSKDGKQYIQTISNT